MKRGEVFEKQEVRYSEAIKQLSLHNSEPSFNY